MNEKNAELIKFYKEIFNWNYLLKFGYYDFVENANKKIAENSETDIIYGKTDVIDPDFFNLDQFLSKSQKEEIDSFKDIPTKPIKFFIPKNDGTKRLLKFPNLFSYCKLLNAIIKNKEEIIARLCQDENSLSRFFNKDPYKFSTTSQIKDKLLIGYNKFYKTDFSNFYHSFYTHAIPWLVEGKRLAKANRRNMNYLGNVLDKLVEYEQDGETHGLPTGNLLTRIIVELSMSSFDKQLRTKLGNNVSFCRYVDDIYFGFNKYKDLTNIKTNITELTSLYNITMNGNKCMLTSYSEINQSSELINYFDNRNIDFNNINQISKQLDDFFRIANNEMLNDIKGSDKLLFTSLRYFIENTRNNKKNKNLENLLKALIYRKSNIGKAFIDKLMELVILDPRLTIYFIQLLNIICKKEKLIHQSIVISYLKKEMYSRNFYAILKRVLRDDILTHKNQESYSILLLFSKFKISLPLKYVINILESLRKDQNEDYDDFSLILLIQTSLFNNQNKNQVYLNELVFQLDKIVSYDYVNNNMSFKSFDSEYFAYDHWLLKYNIFYNYKNKISFKQAVDKLYNQVLHRKPGRRYLSFKSFAANVKQSDSIDEFFLKLLNLNVKLVHLTKVYNSKDL